jgi:lon-related putative ATP-dependent protease
MATVKLGKEQARWRCEPAKLNFNNTSEIDVSISILGQPDAIEALQYGLETRAPGSNVFVRGLSGFGRMPLINQVVMQSSLGSVTLPDRCYVYNFSEPDQPRLLEIGAGIGRSFQQAMDRFAEFIKVDLPQYLDSDIVKSKLRQLNQRTQNEIKEIGRPFDEELRLAGLSIVSVQIGQNMLPTIMPVIEGKAVTLEELQQRRLSDEITEEAFDEIDKKVESFEKKFAELGQEINNAQISHREALQDLTVKEAKQFISSRINILKGQFDFESVKEFLDEINDDLINVEMRNTNPNIDFTLNYRVNLIRSKTADTQRPVISVSNPNLASLVGRIDQEFAGNGALVRSDHLMIKPGALLEADGGFLILEAQDILTEPGSWAALLRTLKTGFFEMGMGELLGLWGGPKLRPKPIPVDIKVILVGNPESYYLLNQYEPRFASLFKVLADFADTIDRDAAGFEAYGNVISNLVQRDGLSHFSSEAVARLIEHGARICAQKGQLTSQFGRIADIAREASFIAEKSLSNDDAIHVQGIHVTDAIANTRRRADIPARRFRRLIANKVLRIDLEDKVVGQINGLAVTSEGPLTFGFPTRITASIGPGRDGAINIEREASLSGNVHTKGFLILKGLIQKILNLHHPLAFSVSIAFEQTYGGIDGDSASAAEFCCLLSALTAIPIKQSMAITGAIDQHGNILPIGGATEKIEGFYDACLSLGVRANHGVIIPESNVGDLMLREDIVEAVGSGTFTIYSVSSIMNVLPLMMERETDSIMEAEDIVRIARDKALEFWLATKH